MRHSNRNTKNLLDTVTRAVLVSVVGIGAAGVVAGCNVDESSSRTDDSRYPTVDSNDLGPRDSTQAVTLASVKSCLAGSAAQQANITGVAQFGNGIQAGTSTAAAAGYAPGDCYLVTSGGDATNWNTSSSVNAGGACVSDPVFDTLCDVGGVSVNVFIPVGSTKLTFDYRFYEWDYVPFEDPFSATLYNPGGQPLASTGSQNSCEFVNKGGSDLALANTRTVSFNVSAYQGQTVKLELRSADRYDNVLDSGALINNLNVVSGAMPCNGPVCGGCASAANCAAIDADGDGVNACTDCDDTNAQIKPGGAEICNGLDDNCSGVADEGGVCCVDNDSDGYTSCNGDCDDSNAAVHPGGAEICDGFDNDCNGLIDFIGSAPVCAPPDDDGDGFNQNDDCDDGDANVYPGAAETCNFKDDDCDGVTDEGTCAVGCVTITDGVNGGSSEDVPLLGDYPTYAAGADFGAFTGISSGGNENMSLFRFNLASITSGLGAGDHVNVTSATFRITVAWNPSYNQVSIHGCNQNWNELTASYANYPASNCDANPVGSFNAGGVGERSVDVKTLANQWLNGQHPNFGFLMREAPVNSHYFYTNGPTTSLQPKLDLCYYVSH